MSSEALVIHLKRQLEAMSPVQRTLSWQFTYLPILEKRMRDHGI